MPVYAYACSECGNAFDARQGFDEPALTECEICGGALRKRYGSIGVSFNGSGFYRTDSRAKPAKEGASAAGESKTPAKKESTTKTSVTAGGGGES